MLPVAGVPRGKSQGRQAQLAGQREVDIARFLRLGSRLDNHGTGALGASTGKSAPCGAGTVLKVGNATRDERFKRMQYNPCGNRRTTTCPGCADT